MFIIRVKGTTVDPQEAFKWYSRADEAGFMLGSYNLGVMWYFRRNRVKRTCKKAYFYFKKAADKNYPQAQYNLAGMLYYGEGVDENKTAAMELFQKSSRKWLCTHPGLVWANFMLNEERL